MVIELVKPEAMANTPDEQPKLDQEGNEYTENSYCYNLENPSAPISLLFTGPVGPHLPKATLFDP